MQIVNTVSGAFQANGNGDWAEIGTANAIKMPVNGYLAIYISNRTQVTGCYNCGNVFFDQLQVSVQKSNLLEEKHYYPFGLPVAAMSSPAANNTKPNRNAYQGNENLTHLNLNLMDFHARQYDAQLGRFWAVDPLSSGFGQDMISAYAGMGNAPEASIDPDGMLSRDKPMMTEMPDGNDAMLKLSMAKLNKFDGAGAGGGFVNFANNWSPKNYGIETLQLMVNQAEQNGGSIRFEDMKVLGVVLPELEFIGKGKPNLLGWEASVNVMFGLGSPLGSGFNYHARGVTMLFDPHYRAAELGYMPPMGNLHTTLDVAGVMPVIGEVFDGINGIYYLIEGDKTNAAWSFAAMAPVGGQAVTALKWGKKASKVTGTLFHYTSEAGYKAIMETGQLLPSIGVKNARHGIGKYLTDIAPGILTMGQTSRHLFGVPWNKSKLTHFIEIDVKGLDVIKNAPYNYMVPGAGPLSLPGRIVNHGVSVFK